MSCKHYLAVFALFLVSSLSSHALAQAPLESSEFSAPDDNDVLVTVNGEAITGEQVKGLRLALSQQLNAGQTISQGRAIDELIDLSLLYQDAIAQEFHRQPDIDKLLTQQYKSLIATLYIQEISEQFIPSDTELREEYQKQLQEIPDQEYRVRYLLVKEKKKAEELIENLNNGAHFPTMAQDHSIDPSSERKGDIGWVNSLTVAGDLLATIEELTVGSYTREPVSSEHGWQILLLEDQRTTIRPTFFDAKESIAQEKLAGSLSDYLSELKSKAVIEYSSLEQEANGNAAASAAGPE